jgi:TIR domain
VPRLFISHSGRDNVYALAFHRWLAANGCEDVFVDLHDIGAGERCRDTLSKANARCEAIVLLASPDSLDSIECQKELELAEALGKEIITAIIRSRQGRPPPRPTGAARARARAKPARLHPRSGRLEAAQCGDDGTASGGWKAS